MSEIPDLPPVLERLLQPGFHEQIGAYALDSLPADERIAFEAHLRDCSQCQTELPVVQEAVVLLRRAIVPESRPAQPPAGPSVRSKQPEVVPADAPADQATGSVEETVTPEEIVQAESFEEPEPVDEEDRAPIETEELPITDEVSPETALPEEPLKSELFVDLPPLDQEMIDALAATEPSAAPVQESRPNVPPGVASAVAARPQKPQSSKLPWIVGGLGLLFGIGAIIAALALAETKGNLEEEISFQNAQIEELNAQRDAYLQQTTAITWTLAPTTLGTPGSGGIVFADPAGTSAILSVYGMAPLSGDQVYQVWYVLLGGTSVAGPALVLDSAGNAVVPLQPDLSPYDGIAITVEPSAGSELPSTNPVLQGFFATS